jgi:ATP-dependent DNA helicase 2 subunit 1
LAADGSVQVLAEKRSFHTAQQKREAAAANSRQQEQRLRTFCEFGDSLVPMSNADKLAIKKQGNANTEFASLIVLGFKPEASVPFHHALEKSYFAYPSDAKSSASVEAFAHLHQAMIRKGVVAMGELLTRVTATSRLVVVRALPEVTENGEDEDEADQSDDAAAAGAQLRPPGFLVTAIPFNDEMRAIEPDIAAKEWELMTSSPELDEKPPPPLVTREIVQAAIDLVQKQTLVGVEIGSVFQNAAMEKFWNYIEHKALGEARRVDEPYDTEIDAAQVRQRAGVQIDAFCQLLPEDDVPTTSRGRGEKGKRKALEPDTTGIDWEQFYRDGTLSKCKVADLKIFLKSIGEPISGKKADVCCRHCFVQSRGHYASHCLNSVFALRSCWSASRNISRTIW